MCGTGRVTPSKALQRSALLTCTGGGHGDSGGRAWSPDAGIWRAPWRLRLGRVWAESVCRVGSGSRPSEVSKRAEVFADTHAFVCLVASPPGNWRFMKGGQVSQGTGLRTFTAVEQINPFPLFGSVLWGLICQCEKK